MYFKYLRDRLTELRRTFDRVAFLARSLITNSNITMNSALLAFTLTENIACPVLEKCGISMLSYSSNVYKKKCPVGLYG